MIHKNIFYFAASAVLLALFGGCSSISAPAAAATQVQSECMQEGISVSPWICKPEVADAYASVGIAKIAGADKAQAIKMAIDDGRIQISKQIQAQVREKLDNFSRTSQGIDKEKVDELYTSILSKIQAGELQVEQKLQSCTMPSGKVYIHVIASKPSFNTALKNAVNVSYKNDTVLWMSLNSKQAIATLEKEFDVVMPAPKSEKVAKIFREEVVSGMIVGRNRKH
ncbi:MAG: hypothetical protein PHU40_11925 [Sulfurimonas sp.]|nr:hypothetical protein [Sulfurimonas sp.]